MQESRKIIIRYPGKTGSGSMLVNRIEILKKLEKSGVLLISTTETFANGFLNMLLGIFCTLFVEKLLPGKSC